MYLGLLLHVYSLIPELYSACSPLLSVSHGSHLTFAGAVNDIFTEKALDEIYNYSIGSARLINKACTHCLMLAAQQGRKIVDDYLVRDVIESELV